MMRWMVLFITAFCLSCAGPSGQLAQSGPAKESGTPANRRFALVIGNGSYSAVEPLKNPPRDAEAVAASLRKLGFDTRLVVDGDEDALRRSVDTLAKQAVGSDAIIVFYAGHAVNFGGENFLLPVSASIAKGADLARNGVNLDWVLDRLRGKAATTIVFLDACRDNPFKGETSVVASNAPRSEPQVAERGNGISTRSLGSGLATVSTASGMLIAFATAPGQVALDGAGDHSPFTQALLANIGEPNLEVRQMLGKVRRDVRNATDGRQIPWDNSSLEAAFFLTQSVAGSASPLAGPTPFDGFWRGQSDGWQLSMKIANGVVSGIVDSCFSANNTRRWSASGPAIEGVVGQDGRINAVSVPKAPWNSRTFKGEFPSIYVSATNQAQLNCPDGPVKMEREH